jgi:hypothetical protein
MAGRGKRTWIAALAGAAALAVVAVAATSVLGAGDEAPRYGKLTIDLSKGEASKAQGQGQAAKPKVIYLKSGETLVDPLAIGTPYLDIKLTGCRKVIDGGVLTQDHDIYVQGSYVANPGEYHVRIGFDDAAVAAGVHPFTITSHLTCLKGVK